MTQTRGREEIYHEITALIRYKDVGIIQGEMAKRYRTTKVNQLSIDQLEEWAKVLRKMFPPQSK